VLSGVTKGAKGAAKIADQPLSKSAASLGILGAGGMAAAGSMRDSVSSRETPAPSVGRLSDIAGAAETTAQNAALSMAGVETPGTGASTGTFMASAGVGLGVGSYQYLGKNTAGAEFKKQFAGKNLFDPSKGKMMGRFQKPVKAAKSAGNALHRSMASMGAAALGTFAAAATASLIDRSTERLSKKVLNTGTPGSRLSQNNVLSGSQSRSRRGRATTSGVSRYAGRMNNTMDGSTVLALHKTGGRGAVLGG
jgi:hypothetical protein